MSPFVSQQMVSEMKGRMAPDIARQGRAASVCLSPTVLMMIVNQFGKPLLSQLVYIPLL